MLSWTHEDGWRENSHNWVRTAKEECECWNIIHCDGVAGGEWNQITWTRIYRTTRNLNGCQSNWIQSDSNNAARSACFRCWTQSFFGFLRFVQLIAFPCCCWSFLLAQHVTWAGNEELAKRRSKNRNINRTISTADRLCIHNAICLFIDRHSDDEADDLLLGRKLDSAFDSAIFRSHSSDENEFWFCRRLKT